MPETRKEMILSGSKTILSFEDILPRPTNDPPHQEILQWAQASGFHDMQDAVRQVLSEGGYLDFLEKVVLEEKEIGFISWTKGLDPFELRKVLRTITAGAIIYWALYNNESFIIPWQDGKENPKDLPVFGGTWENGHYLFKRSISQETITGLFGLHHAMVCVVGEAVKELGGLKIPNWPFNPLGGRSQNY